MGAWRLRPPRSVILIAVDDEAPAAPDKPAEALAPVQAVPSSAPAVPWGIDIKKFGIDYTPIPGGGMLLQMTPGLTHPQLGHVPMAPQFTFRFDQAGWERFQEEIAAGGVKQQAKPRIATASVLPPNLRSG